MTEKSVPKELTRKLYVPVVFVLIMWTIKLLEFLFDFPLYQMGIYPRQIWGLKGILFSPFLHGDFMHLISNSLPILVLGFGLFHFFRTDALRNTFVLFFSTNILLWIIGRSSYHIGASGLIYALAAFLLTAAILQHNRQLGAYALMVVFLYGGMIWGVLPREDHVSWEGHLSGAVSGIIFALAESPKWKTNTKTYTPKNDYRYDFLNQNHTASHTQEINYTFKQPNP